ncbi:RNA polymerase subunit sigma-70 [Amycolatopsis magusensis]|uniref:RNA polymerase subunit sigma-70 n=1 Tax=Amycolatopsis magusensis TaxID=882444 RepID=UPI003C2BD467
MISFDELVAAHRAELYVHCYRMLGSAQDAEDAVQEALLAAWRGLAGFQGRSSLRTWLYRVTTNACLRLSTQRRLLSSDHGPPFTQTAELGEPVTGPVWVEPCPEAVYLRRESVELAFVAALQHLPGNQRAVLILRDVLGFSAAEVAGMLDTSTASVNSAMQRAKATVRHRVPARSQQDELAALGEDGVRELVGALVTAWEKADVESLLDLLTEDVRFTMPPLPAWFDGREDVREFLVDRLFATPWRLLPVTANAQPALACYRNAGAGFQLGGIAVPHLRGGRICWLATFVDPEVVAHFPVPREFPAGDR